GKAGLRMFGELYQILFHLGSVGVHNVNAAAITLRDTPAGPAWHRFGTVQKFAAGVLAMPLPILNLIMLAFTTALLLVGCLTKLSVAQELITGALLLFATCAGVWGYALMRRGGFSAAAFRRPIIFFFLTSTIVGIVTALNSKRLNSQPEWSER